MYFVKRVTFLYQNIILKSLAFDLLRLMYFTTATSSVDHKRVDLEVTQGKCNAIF